MIFNVFPSLLLSLLRCSYFFQRSETDFQSYAKHSRWVLGDGTDGMGTGGAGGDPTAELESEFQALALETSAGPQMIGPSSAKKLWALDSVSPEQGGPVGGVGQKQLADEASKGAGGCGGGIFVDQWRDPTWSGGYSQPTGPAGPDGTHGQPPVLSPRLSEKMVEYVLGGSSPTAMGLKKAMAGKEPAGVKKHGVGVAVGVAGQLANGTLTHDDFGTAGDESLDKKAAGTIRGAPFDMAMATGPQPPLGFPDYAAHAAGMNGHNLMSALDAPSGMLPDYSTGAPNGPNSQQALGYLHGGGQRQQQQPPQGM